MISVLKKLGFAGSLFASLFSFSQSSLAEEALATFWIDHDVLTWSQTSTKPDKGKTAKSSGLVTTPNYVTVGIFWKDYGLYVTPGASGGNVGLSYYPKKELELGLLLGVANTKNEDVATATGTETLETKKDNIGIWATYYLTVDSASTAEFQLTYLTGSEKQTAESTTVDPPISKLP